MNQAVALVIAVADQFDSLLADVKNAASVESIEDIGVTVDDVVAIIAIHRDVVDDRAAWWKLRREVYSKYAEHADIPTRSVALLPNTITRELAELTPDDIQTASAAWSKRDDTTPASEEAAVASLKGLCTVCAQAVSESKDVFLRTSQPPNAFEVAFGELTGKERANFQRAYDKWDDLKKYEAHQKYNYYRKEGLDNSLNLVLRDFTRPKTVTINLKTDQRTIARHIAKRVKQYCNQPNPNLGSPDAPIVLITLSFDIEYEGYAELGFDTRPGAKTDFEIEERTDDCLDFYKWNEGLQRLSCDGRPLKMTLHNGEKIVLTPESDEDEFETHIGEMLKYTLIDARDSGAFAKLPLSEDYSMWVGGTHANYAWPLDEEDDDESESKSD